MGDYLCIELVFCSSVITAVGKITLGGVRVLCTGVSVCMYVLLFFRIEKW